MGRKFRSRSDRELSALAVATVKREAMIERAGNADGEAQSHGGCDDKVGEHLDGVLYSEDHGGTLTQNEEDDRPGTERQLRTKQRRLRSPYRKVG